MTSDERFSRPGEVPEPPALSPEQVAATESRNALRQYDRLKELIQAAVVPGARFRLRPSTLMDLNRCAVDGLMKAPGSYRLGPIHIYGTQHEPPPAPEVPGYVDDMCEYVGDNWSTASPIHLSSYVMWRLNWIHPFNDGNGRSSRAVSYLVLCASLGYMLPGTVSIPDRIARDKQPYYDALDAADAAWKAGQVNLAVMEELLDGHLAAQLVDIHKMATGKK